MNKAFLTSKDRFQDDRKGSEKDLPLIVLMTDTFLGPWAQDLYGLPSYAGWACSRDQLEACENWVRSRSDSSRVRVVNRDYFTNKAMVHIYVWKGDVCDK